MKIEEDERKCASVCWYVSVGLGLLLAVVLIATAGWSFLWGVLLGVLVFLALGFVLPQVFCTKAQERRPLGAGRSSSAGDTAPSSAAPAADAVTEAATARPVTEGQDAGNKPAPLAHPVPEEARKPVTEAAPLATDEVEKPRTFDAPRAGGADDLKQIKGVGPKLETKLNEMGFYHYDQIADWTEAEIAWVDRNLTGFKGRASRDEWVRQAVTLARGEASEFSSRASKGGKA